MVDRLGTLRAGTCERSYVVVGTSEYEYSQNYCTVLLTVVVVVVGGLKVHWFVRLLSQSNR